MTTRLQAINTMLSTIGEPPITTENSTNLDASMASNILDEVNTEVQKMGWAFNTERDIVLTRDINNHIYIPDSVLRVQYPEETEKRSVSQRGNQLFNNVTNSYEFTRDVTVDIVRKLEWTKLPEDAKRYITIRAARIFANRAIGDQESHGYTMLDEMQAKADLKEYELITGNYSMLDSIDMQRAFRRGNAIRGWSY